MSASEYLSLIVVGFLLVWVILVTVLFLKALRDSLAHADAIHDRARAQLDSVLDRLMAMDFQTFKSYEMAAHAPHGGYIEPEEEVRMAVVLPMEQD